MYSKKYCTPCENCVYCRLSFLKKCYKLLSNEYIFKVLFSLEKHHFDTDILPTWVSWRLNYGFVSERFDT